MSYTPNISLNLDIDYAGMAADLRGQLYDGATQATVGGAISGVFFERPGAQAMYVMRPTIPNGHDGWCDIYIDGAPETVIGFFQINPAELENADVKTSTRATPSNVSSAQTAITDAIDALNNITAADVVTALMAYAVESGKDYATVLKEIYAILRGKFEADDADPTSVTFYAPDGTTERVTFAVTSTSRTPS